MKGKLRVLIAKPGLDGHDRGAKIIARGYRDAGFEVVYIGLHQTPEQIVNAAIQEDVDLVGLSCLSGAHLYLFNEVVKQLKEKGAGGITVIGGGIIPKEDIPRLKEAGVKEVFLPGTPLEEVIKWTKENVKTLRRLDKYRGEDGAGRQDIKR
ncbi:cobalamin B12-binding domain-containing protein [Chloroflexota bacterium]